MGRDDAGGGMGSIRVVSSVLCGLAVLLFAGEASAARGVDQELSVKVGIGQNKVLQVSGSINRVAVGSSEIADVKMLGANEVLILGVAEGKTTLLIWRNAGERLSYTISVRKQPPEEIAQEMKALLGDIEGVTIRIIGDRVYLDGETLTTEDAERVNAVVALYPTVRSFVRPSPNALKAQKNNLKKAFEENELKNVAPRLVGNTLFLEGTVESQEDLKKAELVVKAMGSNVENLLTVGIKRMVLVEVQIVEIRRSDDLGIGITYPTSINSTEASFKLGFTKNDPPNQGELPQQTTYDASTTVGTNYGIRMRFDSGYGRLLSRPTLVCASGEEAHFTVGGEIPIPMITAQSANVEWKEFGVILELKPTADRQGNISTRLSAEVSEPDASLMVRFGGIEVPGFRKRKATTNVTVKQGETIVLSGLFNYDQQKNVSKVPLLGHIPIIGELFKTRQFIEKKNELAIFVTPRVVNPDSDRVREKIDKIKERYKDAADAVGFNIWD